MSLFGFGVTPATDTPSKDMSSHAFGSSSSSSSSAASAFSSLAHSYSQLLDVLQQPHEHNVTTNEMTDLLSYLSPRFLRSLTLYPTPSSKSTSLVESGKVPSSFPNEKGEFESQVLHEDWKKIVLEFSKAMQLDALESYHILETYLHLYHSNNISNFFSSKQPSSSTAAASQSNKSGSAASADSNTLNLSELIHFYYTERCSLLQCVSALFRLYLDNAHVYHEAAEDTLRELLKGGLEKEILSRYRESCATQIPKDTSAATKSTTPSIDNITSSSFGAASLFADDAMLASNFADQTVTEQALLLEILFLLFYEDDDLVAGSGAITTTTQAGSNDVSVVSLAAQKSQQRIQTIYGMFTQTNFGRVQPLYTYLSTKGRATVDWISHLCVLIGIELMSIGKLLRVYNHPIQEIKDFILSSSANLGTGREDDELWEKYSGMASLVLEESKFTFEEHAFSDLNFLATIDHLYFDSAWNHYNQQPSSGSQANVMPFYAPLNLAWAVALSQVYEYLEDVQAIRQEFGLHGAGGGYGGSASDEIQEYVGEKQIIIKRLEVSLNCGISPFQLLNGIITRMQLIRDQENSSSSYSSAAAFIASGHPLINGYAFEHSVANLPAYKEIAHELLTALFQSTCYSALESVGSTILTPLFPLFQNIFQEDSSLSYRFWETDEKRPEDRPPVFDAAIEIFPIDVTPFVELLHALAGRSDASKLRVNEDGELLLPVEGGIDSDTIFCADHSFASLHNMKYITTPIPPREMITNIDQETEYNVILLQPWTTAHGITLPANTVGRFIKGTAANSIPKFIQWWHSYSAWPLLIDRIDRAWRLMKSSASIAQLTSKEWLEIIAIVQLMAKVVKANPSLFLQILNEMSSSTSAGAANDTSLMLFNNSTNNNITFNSSAWQQQQQEKRDLKVLVLLLRVQAFVAQHSASIISLVNNQPRASLNQSQAQQQQQQQQNGGDESHYMDATFESQTSSVVSSASSKLTPSHFGILLESCMTVLHIAGQNDFTLWLKAFNLVMGQELSSSSSGLQANIAAANLLSNVSLLDSNSSFQCTYNYLHLLQRSLFQIQAPTARYTVTRFFIEHASTLLMPLYPAATVQNLRARNSAENQRTSDFLPRTAHFTPTDSSQASLPINPELFGLLSSIDMHHVLKFVCESIFVQYDEWKYAVRSDRWKLGSEMLRFFLLVLSNPSAPPNLSTSNPSASPLHAISLQQYLYSLFLTQPSMLLALLRPLLFGLSLLDRLNYDRRHEEEVGLLQDLLVHTFLLLKKLMNLESQKATVAAVSAGGKVASFRSVLLESVAAAAMPSSWSFSNRRRGGLFTATPTSLLQAMTEYANYSRSIDLQSLSINTIRLLCISGHNSASPASNSLANHFTSATLHSFRRTCLQILTAHSTEQSLKNQLLQLLATMFERQPTMAQRFAVTSFLQLQLHQAAAGGAAAATAATAEDENDEDESDDTLFNVLSAWIQSADQHVVGDVQALYLVYRIVAAVWSSSGSNGVNVGYFAALQQRLKTEVPNFWEKLTHCLTVEVPLETQASLSNEMDTSSNSVELMDATALDFVLSVKCLRTCVWNIVNMELFQNLAPNKSSSGVIRSLDAGFESILSGFASSSESNKYIQFLHTYCRSSDPVALHRRCLDQLQQYNLDYAIFTVIPTSEEIDSGLIKTPLYNVDFIERIISMDIEREEERELIKQEQKSQHVQQMNQSFMDTTTNSVVPYQSRSASLQQHREKVTTLLFDLRYVNNALLVADAEMSLMQSWKSFMLICLQTQPSILGIKPKSAMAYEYIFQVTDRLSQERRFGEGVMLCMYVESLSSLLLSFLTCSLQDGAAAGTDLASAILRKSTMEDDESAAGEVVFSKTHGLLQKVVQVLQACASVYVTPITSITSLDSNSIGIVPILSTPLPTPVTSTPLRIAPFQVTSKLSESTFADRIESTQPSTLTRSNKASQQSGQLRSTSILLMQHLLTSALMLTRLTNQLLVQKFIRHRLESLDEAAEPIGRTGRMASPSPMRRLDGSFNSPSQFALPPVLETANSVSIRNTQKLIYAIGDEYTVTCQSMLKIVTSCLSEPLLADAGVTTLPLLLQAIDVVQGANKRRQLEQFQNNPLQYADDAITISMNQLRSSLPLLLHHFANMPLNQPLVALKLVQLFSVLAQYEIGAELLIQHNILLLLCNHRVFHPSHPSATEAASDSSTPYRPSFSPYTPSNTRDVWHQVWVLVLHLIATLLRTMSNKAKLTGLSSNGSNASTAMSATHGKLLEDVLQFFNLYSAPRLDQVLHLSHVYQPSLGSLEELDALTHLIYELEQAGKWWHRVNPNLHQTHRQQILLLTTYYIRLLCDPRELEKRILVVSPDEKADAKDAVGDEESEGGSSKSEFGVNVTRQNTLNFDLDGRGVIDRTKSELVTGGNVEERKAMEEKKKTTWRALGSSSGIGSGSSTPHQLSTPTTPRSSSTPLSQTPSQDDKSTVSGAGEFTRTNSLSLNVMLTPVRGNSSFLLRTPVVGSMLSRRLNVNRESDDNILGASTIVGNNNSDLSAPDADTPKGFAFFTQRIEYAICIILKNCFGYLRVQCPTGDLDNCSMSSLLFKYNIKVVNLGNTSHMNQLMFESKAALSSLHQGIGGSMTDAMGVTPWKKIVEVFSGLGIGIEDEMKNRSNPQENEFEDEYYEANHDMDDGTGAAGAGFGRQNSRHSSASNTSSRSNYTFRAPLSMLIDFQQYALRVLSKLFEIQKQMGSLDTLDQQRKTDRDDETSTIAPSASPLINSVGLPHSDHVMHLSALVNGQSPLVPSIPSIHNAMQFLLENAMFIFVQHVAIHINRLKDMQLQLVQPLIANAQLQAQQQAQQMQQGFGGMLLMNHQSIDVPAATVPPQAIRIGKLLDSYRDRLSGLVEIMNRYIQLISTLQPAPPTLSATAPVTHLRVSRLMLHMKGVLEEQIFALGVHAAEFNRFVQSEQQRHAPQNQQQQQQQQQFEYQQIPFQPYQQQASYMR